MNLIHFDIQREIDDLSQAVNERILLEEPNGGQDDKKRVAEQMVCVQSRSLFSRYVDAALWSGIDDVTTKGVRTALQHSLEGLKTDPACIESVKKRLKAFDDFVQKQSKVVPG